MANLVNRMMRASKLEAAVFEEVEADQGAMGQAVVVVVLSSLAAGIGSISKVGVSGIVWATIVALAGWFLWALLTYVIGTKVLPTPETKSSVGELLRTIGFSSSPGVIRILGIIPFLNTAVAAVASVWMLIAMVIAVRQALDYTSTWRALGVCLIGWIVQLAFIFIAASILKIPLTGQ
jgi:hypothetical protein